MKVETAFAKLKDIFPGKRVKVEHVMIEHVATDEDFARGQDWRLMLHIPSDAADYGAFGHWLSFVGSTPRAAFKEARAYSERITSHEPEPERTS